MEKKFIAKELFITTNKMRRYLDRKQQLNGLYLSQARLITYLYYRTQKGEHVYQVDIENHFQIRKASVSGILNSLSKLNLVKRVDSKVDKRKKKIILTEQGVSKALLAIETIKEFERNLTNIVNDEELLNLNNSLDKINNWLMEKEIEDEEII